MLWNGAAMFDGHGRNAYSTNVGTWEAVETECDAYGENLIKATLPGARWALHHDAFNLQVHRIARQPGKTSPMEVEDLFMRKLGESVIILDNSMPLEQAPEA